MVMCVILGRSGMAINKLKKNIHQESGSTFSKICEVPIKEDNNKMSLVLFHSQQLNQSLGYTFMVYSESWKYLQHFVVWAR